MSSEHSELWSNHKIKDNMKVIYTLLTLAFLLLSPTEATLEKEPKTELNTPDGGKITLLTVHTQNRQTDLVLSKTNSDGNEEWVKYYGGKGWEYGSDLITTKDGGYLILGETSSYGKGNNDVYLLKVTDSGKKQWQNTFGRSYNDYGKMICTTKNGYLINATQQDCSRDSDDPTPEDCDILYWDIYVDFEGNKIEDFKRLKAKDY